jgi:hypothetical protein
MLEEVKYKSDNSLGTAKQPRYLASIWLLVSLMNL